MEWVCNGLATDQHVTGSLSEGERIPDAKLFGLVSLVQQIEGLVKVSYGELEVPLGNLHRRCPHRRSSIYGSISGRSPGKISESPLSDK